jgi:hypothetical protein
MAGGGRALVMSDDGSGAVRIMDQDWGRQPGAFVCTMDLSGPAPRLRETFANTRGVVSAISANGDWMARIVTSEQGSEGMLELWTVRAGTRQRLAAGTGAASALIFVGTTLVVGDEAGRLWLWRLGRGVDRRGIPLASLGEPVLALAPGPGAGQLSVTLPDALVLVDLERDLLSEVAARAGRELLPSERLSVGLPVAAGEEDPDLTAAGYTDPP